MNLKKYVFLFFLLMVGLVLASVYTPAETNYESVPVSKDENKPASDIAFHKMMDVLTHPRCLNCHPSDNIPKQGEDSHPHYFDMARGENDKGFKATKCATCHQSENNPYSGAPGAPHWSLAPHSMRWQGLNRFEIAKSMMDTERNGGRSPEEIRKHLTEDDLVLWAWEPGTNVKGEPRELPPVSKEEFISAVEEWFSNGHTIPSQ
ncbi:hypothetical protein [Zobellia sp. 1_MG-2023]|uniref:hypothetical protein n=1 Tax=Zobellia sp. 1_MG-2023 TaxID=3062626 RepID=UPI0026E1FA55|nr:hypothetical protein [Zobellia sp. 1_MG-2023]MDO6817598.1 hypothetical protein [Zobellia sp. 1_MG-2023]